MARKKSPTLTEAELRLMEVLWERKQATVSEVLAALNKKAPLAYSTVLTTLRILEQKQYVSHKKTGRAFIYFPLVNRSKARNRTLNYIVKRFFDNSPELLLLNLLQAKTIDAREMAKLKKKIEEAEE